MFCPHVLSIVHGLRGSEMVLMDDMGLTDEKLHDQVCSVQ